MKKLDLASWAAVSDILGTVAVVISLVFVAHSVNKNTAELQADNDNLMYELQDASSDSISTNRELASTVLKIRRKEDVSDVEIFQFEEYITRKLNRWELAFNRNKEELLSDEAFAVWDKSYSQSFIVDFPNEWWPNWRDYYGDDFASHIDAVLERAK